MIEGRRIFMNMNDVCIYAYFMVSMTGNVLAAEYGQLILGLVVVSGIAFTSVTERRKLGDLFYYPTRAMMVAQTVIFLSLGVLFYAHTGEVQALYLMAASLFTIPLAILGRPDFMKPARSVPTQGSFIGYDDDGAPIAVAMYGHPTAPTRKEARRFAGEGGLHVREFADNDPDLEAEMDRWDEETLERGT